MYMSGCGINGASVYFCALRCIKVLKCNATQHSHSLCVHLHYAATVWKWVNSPAGSVWPHYPDYSGGSPAVVRGMSDRPALAGTSGWPHCVSFCLSVCLSSILGWSSTASPDWWYCWAKQQMETLSSLTVSCLVPLCQPQIQVVALNSYNDSHYSQWQHWSFQNSFLNTYKLSHSKTLLLYRQVAACRCLLRV